MQFAQSSRLTTTTAAVCTMTTMTMTTTTKPCNWRDWPGSNHHWSQCCWCNSCVRVGCGQYVCVIGKVVGVVNAEMEEKEAATMAMQFPIAFPNYLCCCFERCKGASIKQKFIETKVVYLWFCQWSGLFFGFIVLAHHCWTTDCVKLALVFYKGPVCL